MHDSSSNFDKLDRISFLKLKTPFFKITQTVLNIYLRFRKAKSVNNLDIFMLFIRHVILKTI